MSLSNDIKIITIDPNKSYEIKTNFMHSLVLNLFENSMNFLKNSDFKEFFC